MIQIKNIVLKEPLEAISDNGEYMRVRDFCINNCPKEIWDPEIHMIYSLSNETYSSLEHAKAEAGLLQLERAAESYSLSLTTFLETYQVLWKGKISERDKRDSFLCKNHPALACDRRR